MGNCWFVPPGSQPLFSPKNADFIIFMQSCPNCTPPVDPVWETLYIIYYKYKFRPCSCFQGIFLFKQSYFNFLTSLINLMLSEADRGPPKHLT